MALSRFHRTRCASDEVEVGCELGNEDDERS